ncbi:MAG: cobaltochelatase subunit CobS [Betaproteobacteria bacterium]|nr:cobaltochelatase subunit CobS [Betaproteobacteria bacterium]
MSRKFSDRVPQERVDVRTLFGLDLDMQVPAFAERDEHVPEIDPAYRFNRETTLAILAGFVHNRRVAIQGCHGTGKSTHIEQVAARLNWPCVRINLDGHIGRLDLVGKDVITIRDGQQVTEFQEGVLPWALQRPIALVFDEYDAGRPEVMFVIQRVLERDGGFTLLDQKRVIHPHPWFRLFATMNTLGQGNSNGLYHGSQILNHAQLDRWSLFTTLDYMPPEEEAAIVLARVPALDTAHGKGQAHAMVTLAGLTRRGFAVGDLSVLMSPRTVITWAENLQIFQDLRVSFELSFFNKCEADERVIVSEYFQRVFGEELHPSRSPFERPSQ